MALVRELCSYNRLPNMLQMRPEYRKQLRLYGFHDDEMPKQLSAKAISSTSGHGRSAWLAKYDFLEPLSSRINFLSA